MISSTAAPRLASPRRGSPRLPQVPFVELFAGRVQGVVATSPALERVHAVQFEAYTGNWACASGERPCPCAGPQPCVHVHALVQSAVQDFGRDRVARYLGRPELCSEPWRLVPELGGSRLARPDPTVLARFLDYLRYVQLPSGVQPTGGLVWFPTG